MAAQPIVRRSDLPARLLATLEQLEARVQSNIAAMAIWTKHFTDAERKALGDDAYQAWKNNGRTAGMWAAARDVSLDQAIVEIAYALDWVDTKTSSELLEALGGGKENVSKPRWLKEKRELWFEGQIVRQIRNASRAKNIIAILDAFEDSGWPKQIDDPVTSGGDSSQRRRTIESLNVGLKRIRFSCLGDGLSFGWEILKQRTRRPAKKKAAGGAGEKPASKRTSKKPRRKSG
jgi:hypothetical protein